MDYTDFMHDFVERFEKEEDSGDSQETPGKRYSTKDTNAAKKRKRGPGRPAKNKSSMERRQEANDREKKRMRALVRWRELFYNKLVLLTVCLSVTT